MKHENETPGLARHTAVSIVLDSRLDRPTGQKLSTAEPLVIATTGMISREAFEHRDRPEHFYMIGSMGLASMLGLGLALAQPDRRVVVLDGDGSALMGLGHLAMVAEQGPRNLLHVVFDNRCYGSTGGQRSITDRVPLDRLAEAAGYGWTARADDAESLKQRLAESAELDGPAFLLVRVSAGNLPGVGRVSLAPAEITRRFRAAATEDLL